MTYSTLSKRPLLLVTISVMIGMVFGVWESNIFLLTAAGISIGLMAYHYCRPNEIIRMIAILSFFIFLGALLSSSHQSDRIFDNELQINEEVVVHIEEIKEKKEYKYLTGSLLFENVNARLLIRLPDSCNLNIGVGSVVKVNSKIWQPGQARTPNGFDYRQYLRTKNIELVNYSRCWEVEILEKRNSYLSSLSNTLNSILLNKIDEIFKGIQSIALVKGILLGCKDDMETSQKELFSLAGVGHVFAVSGMHVGMVYLLCWPLLLLRHRNRYVALLLPLVVLVVVWLFVMASGMTPSAMRAGTMISFYELGKLLNRKVDKWNILSVAALISVCLDPHIIKDIGFQFSYLALGGIFFFYARLSQSVKFKNRILNLVSNMVILSISAQLALLPLSLFYFGSFSPYFWLSSLVAMLIVQLNFILSFFAILISYFGFSTDLLIFVIDMFFGFLSDSVQLIMTLPWSAISWKPDLFKMLFGYQLIGGLAILMVAQNRYRALSFIFISLVLSIGSKVVMDEVLVPAKQLIIFHDEAIKYTFANAHTINEATATSKTFDDGLLCAGNNSYQVWNDNANLNKVIADVVILDDDDLNLARLMANENLSRVIVTQNLSWRKRNKIKNWCASTSIPYTNLSHGFLTIDL